MLEKANPPSVDAYIRHLSEKGEDPDGEMRTGASYAVALVLTNLERSYELKMNPPDDWMIHVVRTHLSHLHSTSPSDISFVTFNYDNLIERHLVHRLSGYMGDEKGAERASQIPVVHVHGNLLRTDIVAWQLVSEFKAGENTNWFGTSMYGPISHIDEKAAAMASRSLKFFWENDMATEASNRAARFIAEADIIVVIGVGAAIQPLEQLFQPFADGQLDDRIVVGTCFGLDSVNRERLASIFQRVGVSPSLSREKAHSFMEKRFPHSYLHVEAKNNINGLLAR
ncbi:MAG: hypothetical protein ACREJD_10250 [Phycisphaerales bacterium]